jgi:hypothetical protein
MPESTMASILWTRLDAPGHDSCGLERLADGWRLSGVAAFAEDGLPSALAYEVLCDEAFVTRSALVQGFVGDTTCRADIVRSGLHWSLDGVPQPEVEGCLDVDLSFTPATNLLAIRRLALGIGGEAPCAAAWLLFPERRLARLDQTYRRVDETRYAYRGSGYADTLETSRSGFVTTYPGLWQAEHVEDGEDG